METLRCYLATLTPAAQVAYAQRSGTTIGYLRKALSTRPRLDGALVRQLWLRSGGAVSLSDLRPDIWPPEGDASWPDDPNVDWPPAEDVCDAA